MSFHIGQKVVCLRDTPGPEIKRWASGHRTTKIKVGCVYTIRDIDYRALDLHGVACLRFEGVHGRPKMTTVGMWEAGYPASYLYFRPVVQTDISIFKKMLAPTLERDLCAAEDTAKGRP